MTEKRYSDGTLAKWYYSQTNVICDGNNEYYLRHKESVKDFNYNDLLGTNDLLDELNRLSDKNEQLRARIQYLERKIQRERNIHVKEHEKWEEEIQKENEQLKKALMELKEIGDYQEGRIKELSYENDQLQEELLQCKAAIDKRWSEYLKKKEGKRMTEKRFTYEYDEYDGNLFDNKMNTFYHIEDSDENIKVLCDRLNWLVDENEQLKHDATVLIQANQDYRRENDKIKSLLLKKVKDLNNAYQQSAKNGMPTGGIIGELDSFEEICKIMGWI